jgi:hypothetical protein
LEFLLLYCARPNAELARLMFEAMLLVEVERAADPVAGRLVVAERGQ